MEQYENSINRNSGRHLISDQDHMGEVIERLQSNQQGGGHGEQSRGQQQQGDSERTSAWNAEKRTRQAY